VSISELHALSKPKASQMTAVRVKEEISVTAKAFV
jgi:hypothetical protein